MKRRKRNLKRMIEKNTNMTAIFKKKKLTPPKRVCLRLKEEREKIEMSLDDLAKKTKIDKKYLKALEECRFKDLPEAAVYQKNFVKKYIEALGIESSPFLSQYESEEKVLKNIKHPRKCLKMSPLSNLPSVIRFVFSFVIILGFLTYLVFQIRNIVEPPQLFVYSPQDGFITTEMLVVVQGKTEEEVMVYINGKEIGTSNEGNFEEMIDLGSGVNTFIIVAKKKHGKNTEVVRHVVQRSE